MKQLEEKIEKNMFEKDIFEKYAYKCKEIYLPRLKYYLEKIINIHNLTPSGLLLPFDKELDWQAQQKTKLEQLLARQLPLQSDALSVEQCHRQHRRRHPCNSQQCHRRLQILVQILLSK
ncbi:hypothetical protein [Rickettsiella massiliensis]|uniref:hypothetical protein n=1 Tax=Rickettsiella massiliensis TaxID=676517 RepID=UPI0012EAC704|nr:hypothetical protein [Rickettsiella massiliensis]